MSKVQCCFATNFASPEFFDFKLLLTTKWKLPINTVFPQCLSKLGMQSDSGQPTRCTTLQVIVMLRQASFESRCAMLNVRFSDGGV